MEKQLNDEQWLNTADTVGKLCFLNKLQQQVEQCKKSAYLIVCR